MSKKNYYEILGVNKTDQLDVIKKRFRTLARQYHPDLNNAIGSEEKFKEINEAYKVLSDKQKRKYYDEFIYQQADEDEAIYEFTDSPDNWRSEKSDFYLFLMIVWHIIQTLFEIFSITIKLIFQLIKTLFIVMQYSVKMVFYNIKYKVKST